MDAETIFADNEAALALCRRANSMALRAEQRMRLAVGLRRLYRGHRQAVEAALRSLEQGGLDASADAPEAQASRNVSRMVLGTAMRPSNLGLLSLALFKKGRSMLSSVYSRRRGEELNADALRTAAKLIDDIVIPHYGERLLCRSVNIGQGSVVANKEDREASKQLYDRLMQGRDRKLLRTTDEEEHPITRGLGQMVANPSAWQSVVTTGICWGTVTDLCERYLRDEDFDRLPELAQIYEKGGTSEACANQALYSSLQSAVQHPAALIFDQLDLMQSLASMPLEAQRGLFNADFNLVRVLLRTAHERGFAGAGQRTTRSQARS